jgi:hypothetical protein
MSDPEKLDKLDIVTYCFFKQPYSAERDRK